jgi:hypothetical protein
VSQWNNVVGFNKCRVCGVESKEVQHRRGLQNIPICDKHYKGLMKGDIDPLLLFKPPTKPQPMNTTRTTSRQGAGRGTFNRELANARWIKCDCGGIFKTPPYKKFYDCVCHDRPSHDHPPASEQWVRHAVENQTHVIADFSDRNPDGNDAWMSRALDNIRMLEAKLEKEKK